MGRCLISHKGPLCYICEEKHARYYAKGTCESCKSNWNMYIKMAAAFLGIYIYIMLQVKFTFRKTRSTSGIIMKQLINHLQQLSMISLLDLRWTDDIRNYFSIQEYFSFASEELVSLDCLLIDIPGNLLAKRVIITYLLPIFLSLFTTAVFFITYNIDRLWKKRLKRHSLTMQAKASVMVIVYLLYSEILRKIFLFDELRTN